jgi:hypothetical protein
MADDDPLDAVASDDDEKLFDDITQGVPETDEPELPLVAPEPVAAASEAAETRPAAEAPQASDAPAETVMRHVPLRELLDERDKRQAERVKREAAEKLAEERARELQQILAAQRAEREKQPEVAVWDQPTGWFRQQISPLEQKLFRAIHAISERDARREHGNDLVEKALNALDPAMRAGNSEAIAAWQRMMESDHPYHELADWFRRTEPVRDPEGYRTRIQDESLKDAGFLQRAQEALRASAAANPVTHQPNAAASLPSVSRSGTPASTSEEDPFAKLSDEDAYEYVLRDKQGRFASRA